MNFNSNSFLKLFNIIINLFFLIVLKKIVKKQNKKIVTELLKKNYF